VAQEEESRFGGVLEEVAPVSRFGGVLEGVAPEEVAPVSRFGGVLEEDPGVGVDYEESLNLIKREEELLDDMEDWSMMRRELRYADEEAAYTDDPAAKHRAMAKARYLQGKSSQAESVGAKKYLESGGTIPGSMPGEKTPFFASMDTANAFVSWFARPGYSGLSAAADVDYISEMDPDKFSEWVENLHEDDPRRGIFRRLSKNRFKAQKASAEGELVTRPGIFAEAASLTVALQSTYWAPNAADPYGGYGLPKPWQEIEKGGRVVGGPPATFMDILTRGAKATSPLGAAALSSVDFGPEGEDEAQEFHEWMQRVGGRMLPQGPGRYQERRIEKAIEAGDPEAGLLLPTLFFSIGPDFLLPGGLITKAGKAVFKTGAGNLTKAGDRAVSSSILRHNRALTSHLEGLAQSGKEVNPRTIDALSNKLMEKIKETYAKVGDAALKGERFNRGLPRGVGLERFNVGDLKMFRNSLDVVHINVDDAVKIADGTFSFDASKVRVLYADDSSVRGLVLAASGKSVKEGADASAKATKELEKLLGSKKAEELFGKERQFNMPLLGFGAAMMGAAGAAATDEDDAFLKKLGMTAGLAVLGAIPGTPVGRVFDATGKKLIGKLTLKPGSVGFSEIANGGLRAEDARFALGPVGGAIAKAQQQLPFFKRMRPWAVKVKHTIEGKATSYWKVLEASDLLGPHAWTRMEYLTKKMGYTRRKMSAALNEAVHNATQGTLLRPRERDLLSHFAEALGEPVAHAEDAVNIFKALRNHLNRVVEWSQFGPRVRPGQPAVVSREGEVVSPATFREVSEGFRGRPVPECPSKEAAAAEGAGAREGLELEQAVSGTLERAGKRWAEKARRIPSDQDTWTAEEILRGKVVDPKTLKRSGGMRRQEKALLKGLSKEQKIAKVQETLDRLEGAGLAHARGAEAKRAYIAEPALWETFARKGKGKARTRATTAKRKEIAAAAKKVPRGGVQMPRQVLVDDVPVDVPMRGAAEKDLLENLGEAFSAELALAQTVSGMLRQITLRADLDEMVQLTKLRKELEASIVETELRMSDKAFESAVAGMTVQQARQAARAVARPARRVGERWEDLTPDQKGAVGAVREFFKDMYHLLRAEGALKEDWKLSEFLEQMEVEGYVHHLFTSKGREKFKSLRESFRSFSSISTEADFLKKRSTAGTIEEVNEGIRRGIAEMIYREVNKLDDKAFLRIDKAQRDADIQGIIASQGLDDIKFFETDAARIMQRYSKKVSRMVSNKRYIDDVLSMFPEGSAFSALAVKKGRDIAEKEAALAGFRRVDNLKHMRAVIGEDYWAGWDKYRAQIKNISDAATDGPAYERELFKFLKSQGVDLGDQRIVLQGKAIASDVYVPYVYADFIEALGDTSWLDELAHKNIWVGYGLGSFDSVLDFFKVATTVAAPAFHGRNYISNVVTNMMAPYGWRSVSPPHQMKMIAIMRASDDDVFSIIQKTEGGQEILIEQTAGQWKQEWRMQGIITDHLNPADIRGGRHGDSPRWRAPAMTGGAGAILGAGVGYTTEDDPDRRLVKAFAGAILGGGAGVVGASALDLFARKPFQAYRAERAYLAKNPNLMENSKGAFSVAFDEWLDIVGYESKLDDSALMRLAKAVGTSKAAQTAYAGGFAGAAVGLAVPAEGENRLVSALKIGMMGMLATGGVKAVGEGAFILSGGVGRKIEEQAKICSYMAGRKIGLSPDAAADITNKTLFNYDDLTAFERHWLKRIFPFYTWTSKNATELQPFLLKERPLQFSALTKLMEAAENSFSREQDMNLLPEHLRYRLAFSSGLGKIIAGFGLPQEDLVQLFQMAELGRTGMRVLPTGLISRVHPIIPFLTRFVFGTDPYYNVDLDRVRSARDVRYLPEGVKRWAGYAEVPGIYVDPQGQEHHYTKYEVGWFQTERSKSEGVPWEVGCCRRGRRGTLAGANSSHPYWN